MASTEPQGFFDTPTFYEPKPPSKRTAAQHNSDAALAPSIAIQHRGQDPALLPVVQGVMPQVIPVPLTVDPALICHQVSSAPVSPKRETFAQDPALLQLPDCAVAALLNTDGSTSNSNKHYMVPGADSQQSNDDNSSANKQDNNETVSEILSMLSSTGQQPKAGKPEFIENFKPYQRAKVFKAPKAADVPIF